MDGHSNTPGFLQRTRVELESAAAELLGDLTNALTIASSLEAVQGLLKRASGDWFLLQCEAGEFGAPFEDLDVLLEETRHLPLAIGVAAAPPDHLVQGFDTIAYDDESLLVGSISDPQIVSLSNLRAREVRDMEIANLPLEELLYRNEGTR